MFVMFLLLLSLVACQNIITGTPHDTELTINVTLYVDEEKFIFSPLEIPESYVQKDIFKPGHFSILDCLVHLNEKKLLSSFKYHFDESSQSYVIDDLEGSQYWWYHVHYDQGKPEEESSHRMSYYLVKDMMYIKFYKTTKEKVDHKLKIFETEVERTKKAGGDIIIPVVYFNRSKTNQWKFLNVKIPSKNHGLRNDLFYDNVITAADVFLTLGDENKIKDEFLWYVHLWDKGTHDPNPLIKAYRVESIDGYNHSGACGWVFEFGEWQDLLWKGNMIHVQPDEHILKFTPEYFLVYWIELGPC